MGHSYFSQRFAIERYVSIVWLRILYLNRMDHFVILFWLLLGPF